MRRNSSRETYRTSSAFSATHAAVAPRWFPLLLEIGKFVCFPEKQEAHLQSRLHVNVSGTGGAEQQYPFPLAKRRTIRGLPDFDGIPHESTQRTTCFLETDAFDRRRDGINLLPVAIGFPNHLSGCQIQAAHVCMP